MEFLIVCIIFLGMFLTWYISIKPKEISISFKESLDLCNLPIVTFTNNGNKYNFLLDTGASLNVINERVLDTIGYNPTNMIGDTYGIEGNKQAGIFVEIWLDYKNDKIDTTFKDLFQVTDLSQAFDNVKQESGVTLHGILGNNFFVKYKYILDFEKLKFYSKQK